MKNFARLRFSLLAVLIFISTPTFAASTSSDTQPAQEPKQPIQRSKYLQRSGVAYDATENEYGAIKVTEPRNFFTPRTKQVTWWGEFKPFSSWSRPELHADFYDPDGVLATSRKFQPEACRLAKVTFVRPGNIELKEGRWVSEIWMDGRPIDRKQFVVFNPRRPPVTSAPTSDVQIDTSQDGGKKL